MVERPETPLASDHAELALRWLPAWSGGRTRDWRPSPWAPQRRREEEWPRSKRPNPRNLIPKEERGHRNQFRDGLEFDSKRGRRRRGRHTFFWCGDNRTFPRRQCRRRFSRKNRTAK